MATSIITSRQNPLVKELQAIRDERNSPLLFLEGARLVYEALQANHTIEILVYDEDFPETSFLDPIRAKSKREFKVSSVVFKAVTDVETPQGLLAVCRKPSFKWEDVTKRAPAPIVILDGLQDPGNTATIVRTAEAAGAAGIVTTPGTAHLFAPKALRGAMGSSLRLPILEHQKPDTIVKKLREAGYSLIGTVGKTDGAKAYTTITWSKPWAMVFGHEAKGISGAWGKLCDGKVFIPMQAPVESLNVASAAAILLYEALRQRN